MRLLFAFLVLTFAGAACTPSPLATAGKTPIFEPAIDYAMLPVIEGCEENVVPSKLRYHSCRNSRSLYDAALASAKSKNQPLMMVFGFNTCPACLALERSVFDPEQPILNKDVTRYFSQAEIDTYEAAQTEDSLSPLKISTVFIYGRSDHGQQLAHDLGLTKIAIARGSYRVWSPFVVFVNPQTGAMNTEAYWNAEDTFCEWPAEFAENLQKIGVIDNGKPRRERARCKR